MFDLFKFITAFVLVYIFAVLIMVSLVLFPFALLEGQAKSEYIKQTSGVEMPWYQACWIEVEINDAKLKVE